jgi:ABC-type amino acid transport substrate-binding protein
MSAAAMRKGDPLLGDMNAAIKALRENGTYKAINDKYFAFDSRQGQRQLEPRRTGSGGRL